jgi:hypothetical protein
MVFLIILVALVFVLTFTTLNLLKKQERSEDILAGYLEYLDKISRVIEASDAKIKQLDITGAFANDDETGTIFEGIKQIQDILNDFQLKNIS